MTLTPLFYQQALIFSTKNIFFSILAEAVIILYSIIMRSFTYPVLCIFCILLLAGCQKNSLEDRDLENAFSLTVENVSAQELSDIEKIYNFPEPTKKIAVVFGYGYNDEAFVAATVDELSKKLGLADQGGAVLPLVFPDDFMVGSYGRISLLPEILTENHISSVIIVGAPEGTHWALATIDEKKVNGFDIPVISLFPQDDILGIEFGSDMVLEFVTKSLSEDTLQEELVVYQKNIPQLVSRVAQYMSFIPVEYGDGFVANSELLVHARQMVGSDWSISRYIDPETGLCALNHFAISAATE